MGVHRWQRAKPGHTACQRWRAARLLPLLLCATLALPAAGLLASSASSLTAQERRPLEPPDGKATAQHLRLYLKDGSYQLVLSYQVKGDRVLYQSAERDGATEDLPLEQVDLPATERWKREHGPGAPASSHVQVLSPELAREEAQRAALTPEIAPDLRLPEEDSVLALDTFRGTGELVPLPQQGSDLNKETAHAVNKLPINPASSPHRILSIPGPSSDIQLHVPDPVFYVRVGTGDDEGDGGGGGGAFTVQTHGAAGRPDPSGGAAGSTYVVERLDARQDLRVLDSFRLNLLGSGEAQPDLIELKAEVLPGGRWLKLMPLQPLSFGEYALVEVLNGHEVNLDVWDFGVHSDAAENVEAIHPEPKRPVILERRPQ